MILEFYELVESYITLTVLVSHCASSPTTCVALVLIGECAALVQDKARLYGVGLPAKLNRAVMDNLKRMVSLLYAWFRHVLIHCAN